MRLRYICLRENLCFRVARLPPLPVVVGFSGLMLFFEVAGEGAKSRLFAHHRAKFRAPA